MMLGSAGGFSESQAHQGAGETGAPGVGRVRASPTLPSGMKAFGLQRTLSNNQRKCRSGSQINRLMSDEGIPSPLPTPTPPRAAAPPALCSRFGHEGE